MFIHLFILHNDFILSGWIWSLCISGTLYVRQDNILEGVPVHRRPPYTNIAKLKAI